MRRAEVLKLARRAAWRSLRCSCSATLRFVQARAPTGLGFQCRATRRSGNPAVLRARDIPSRTQHCHPRLNGGKQHSYRARGKRAQERIVVVAHEVTPQKVMPGGLDRTTRASDSHSIARCCAGGGVCWFGQLAREQTLRMMMHLYWSPQRSNPTKPSCEEGAFTAVLFVMRQSARARLILVVAAFECFRVLGAWVHGAMVCAVEDL